MKFNILICALCVLNTLNQCSAFNVGVSGTRCNLDPSKGSITDPCKNLYNGECGGTHCRCPLGYSEDPKLKKCVRGTGVTKTSSGGGLFDDLPLDYNPNKKPGQPQPPPSPTRPTVNQPGYNPNQPGYNPNQPAPVNPNRPGQPGYNPGYPNQPGYNPNQPGYNPNQPGYNPNQPGYNPNRPGYNPNQPGYNPGYNPNQPGHYDPNRPGKTSGKNLPHPPKGKPRPGGDPHMGEKAGGGVGGVIGLLIIGAIIYFCCFKGKKDVLGKFQGLPFMKGRGGGGQAPPPGGMPMQAGGQQHDPNFSSQHTYIPPDGTGGQQPYPPQGWAPQGPQYPPGPYPGYPQGPPMGAPYPGMPPQGPPMGPAPPMGPMPPGGPLPPIGQPMPYPTQINYPMAEPTKEAESGGPQAPPPYTEQYQPNAPPPQ